MIIQRMLNRDGSPPIVLAEASKKVQGGLQKLGALTPSTWKLR